ncbi:MAG: TolC family protein [Spirochaetales bacterium]|nr:TolC family protein [Spirochaetales bacterium]
MKNRLILLIFIIPVFPLPSMDINLAAAERFALEASKPIRNGRQQLNLMALNSSLELRNFLPQIEINYSDSRQVTTYAPDSDSLQLGIDITQPIFDGGREIKSRTLADIQLHLQAAILEQQIEELRDQVWQLFYGLLLNREKLVLQRELLDISSLQLAISLKKFELGSLTELDYLEAAIEVQNMELGILETENQGMSLRQDFAQLLGFEPRYFSFTPLNLKGDVNREYMGLPLRMDELQVYEDLALRENLELSKKKADLNQLKAELEIIRASWIPNLALEASFFLRGTRFPLQQPGYTLALKIDFPFNTLPSGLTFGGGPQSTLQNSRSASGRSSLMPDLAFIINEKSASLKLMQAGEGLDDSITAIERSVYSSLEKLKQKRLSLNLRRSTQDLQAKRMKILQTRSLMGEVTEQELLKTRIEYYEKEINIREAVLDLLLCEREFEQLLGLGLGELSEVSKVIEKGDRL